MPKILEPGEISALDASALPRIRLPERPSVFADRARRLRALARDNTISGYLQLMAVVVDAQHAMLAQAGPADLDRDSLGLALAHGMPVVPAVSATLDEGWRDSLQTLVTHVRKAVKADPVLSPALSGITPLLDRLDAMSAADLDRQAAAVLDRDLDVVDIAVAPFIHAALQVIWTHRACALETKELPYLDTPGLCPACGSPPVASIVRIGGVHEGYRYLQCSLCATEFHFVRVKCAHCESTKGIAYRSLELSQDKAAPDGSPIDIGKATMNPGNRVSATRAESCDECHSYLKIFAQDKAPEAEPFADDLASLALDLMMNDAGYSRPNPHPFLWPSRVEDVDASDK